MNIYMLLENGHINLLQIAHLEDNKADQLTCVSQCQGHTHALQHFVVSPTPPSSLVPVLC